MSFKFEKLEVWKEAQKFATLVYRKTVKFPVKEKYGLTSQIRRAAVSVSLNIAEGSDRKSDKDFTRYLRIAIGSLNEVVTIIYVANYDT